jgi:outer membrane protein assembly factor BamB
MEFVARSAQNGCVLWKRSLPSGFGEQSSLVIATAPRVYVALVTNVLCLDAASGATLAQINLFTQQMRITWIALSGDLLLGLGRVVQGSVTNSEIAAYHTVSNTIVWRYPYAGHVDPRLTAVAGGTLYFYTGERLAGCLDLSSGVQRWLVSDTTPLSGTVWTFQNYASSICTSNGFYVFPKENAKIVAFAAMDGHIMWQTNRVSDWWLLVDGKLRTQGTTAFDALSGAGSTAPYLSGSICGHYTGSPEAYYSQLGRTYDRRASASVLRVGDNNGEIKSGCGSGTYAANGVYLSFPQPCTCNHQGRGYIAQCSESNAMALARDRGPRLEIGQGGTNVANPLATDDNDWWTYRANNQRTASTRVTVPAAARLLWQYTPGTLYRTFPTDIGTDDADETPSPAVTEGVLLFFGGSDGIVRCLNAGTGTQAWMFATGGRIFSAPTVRDGRVYVGSSDGYAYCLDANTGRLLWRYRASATLRSIMVYGNLMNSWPVNTGITIHNGSAYFSAGILDHHDVFAYALDAYSGAGTRQWLDVGNWNALQHRGAAGYGYMAVVTNRVWMRGGNAPMAIFDAATGTATQHISLGEWLLSWMGFVKRFGYATNRGKEIGLLANRFLIYGGRLFYADQSERAMGWQGGQFSFVGIDAQGNARFPEVPALTYSCALAPAWDDTHFVLAKSGNYNNLECWDTASVTSFLDTAIEANKANPATPYYLNTNFPASVRVWGPQPKQMNALALASNAIIVAYTKGAPTYAHWYVTALSRANGASLWEFQLPAEPLFSGVSIDRNGSVIVVLRDGRVAAYGDSSLRIVTPATLPMAGVGNPYSHALQAIGGTAPYTWALQSGALPNGMDMSSNGVISGTAVMMQTNTFTARVSDAALAETAQAFTLEVTPEPTALLAPLLAVLVMRRGGNCC